MMKKFFVWFLMFLRKNILELLGFGWSLYLFFTFNDFLAAENLLNIGINDTFTYDQLGSAACVGAAIVIMFLGFFDGLMLLVDFVSWCKSKKY